MIEAVIFDFDGVIVDSEPLHYQAFCQALSDSGAEIDYARYLDRYVGFDDRDFFRVFLTEECRRKDLAEDDQYVSRLIEQKGDAFEAICNQGVTTINGSVEFIKQAAEHLPLAIASGATKRDIDLILAGLDIGELFCAIVTADDVAQSKPNPTVYRMAVDRIDKTCNGKTISPGKCVAIEDTAAGIEAARGAGLWTVGLTTTGPVELLHQAHRVAEDLTQIDMEKLNQWFG